MDGKRKTKVRQSVRRHWKPSLGRFVDIYDRSGEHARRVVKRVARRSNGEQARSPSNAEPRMGHRLVISVCAFGLTLAIIGGFRLSGQRRVAVQYDVLVATTPVVVKIDHGSARGVMNASTTKLKELVGDAVALIRTAAAEHPDRLIVIDMIAPVLSYESLSDSDQRALRRNEYETAIAGFVDRVVTAVADPHLSVLGLPAEPGAAGVNAARRTNRRYSDVIKRLDHLVTAHVFFRTESWLTEPNPHSIFLDKSLADGA
jgi:hypothetical protein